MQNKGKRILIDIIYIAAVLAFAYACYGLFANMAVNTDGNFKSDLPYYINRALNGKNEVSRLPYFLFRVLYNLTGSKAGISAFLAAVVAFLMFANYGYIRYIGGIGRTDRLGYDVMAKVMSMAVPFIGIIYLPGVRTWFYRNSYPIYAWHSPTQQIMTLFAVLGMLCLLKMFDGYEEKISFRWWLGAAVSFLISAYAKPSFILDLGPALIITFLIELFSKNSLALGEKFRKLFIMGCTLVPAGIYMLGLSYMIYVSSDKAGDGSVVISSDGFSLRHMIVALCFSWAFSLIVGLFNLKKVFCNRKLTLVALTALMGLLQAIVFDESGRRANHGNFLWGRIIGGYMLTLTCAAVAIDNYKDPEFMSKCRWLRVPYFILLAAAFVLQVGSQVYYFYTMCLGGGYYR